MVSRLITHSDHTVHAQSALDSDLLALTHIHRMSVETGLGGGQLTRNEDVLFKTSKAAQPTQASFLSAAACAAVAWGPLPCAHSLTLMLHLGGIQMER